MDVDVATHVQRVTPHQWRLAVRVVPRTTSLRTFAPHLRFMEAPGTAASETKRRRVRIVECSHGNASSVYDGLRKRALLERTTQLDRGAHFDLVVGLDTRNGGHMPRAAHFTCGGETGDEQGNDGAYNVHVWREAFIDLRRDDAPTRAPTDR